MISNKIPNNINTMVFEIVSIPCISYTDNLISVIPNNIMALIRMYFSFFQIPIMIKANENTPHKILNPSLSADL